MVNYILDLLIALPAVIMAIGFHESAHAFVAYKMGDNTAKNLGRLSVNPLKHIDPIGFICLFLFHFGWAKPVPINPNNFKDKKKGAVLTALAGPVSNLLLAFIFSIFYMAAVTAVQFFGATGTVINVLIEMLGCCVSINISLAIFNLIPIPPLDGAKIFGGILPKRLYFSIMEHENIIQLVLLILLFSGAIGWLITPICTFLINIFLTCGSFIVYWIIFAISYIGSLFIK